MNKKEVKKICINCGSENYYAKHLCKNCYNKFLRSNFRTPEDFAKYDSLNYDTNEKKLKIKALGSVLKFSYADLARHCGVSRELVRQWFSGRGKVSNNYVHDVFEYLSDLANDTRNILNDVEIKGD